MMCSHRFKNVTEHTLVREIVDHHVATHVLQRRPTKLRTENGTEEDSGDGSGEVSDQEICWLFLCIRIAEQQQNE
jgi:hypothetical protein